MLRINAAMSGKIAALITESRPLKHVGRKKWGTQDDLRAPQRLAVAFGSLWLQNMDSQEESFSIRSRQ